MSKAFLRHVSITHRTEDLGFDHVTVGSLKIVYSNFKHGVLIYDICSVSKPFNKSNVGLLQEVKPIVREIFLV